MSFRTDRTTHRGPNGKYDHIGIYIAPVIENGVTVGFAYYDSGGTNERAIEKKKKNANSTYKAGPRLSTYYFTSNGNTTGTSLTGCYRPNYVPAKNP